MPISFHTSKRWLKTHRFAARLDIVRRCCGILVSLALLYKTLELTYLLICFSLLPAAISALTLLVGCLSRARCRLAYGPADATATPYVFSKIQIGSTFLVPAHPGSPVKRAVKCVCVCVCVCYYLLHACVEWILNTVDWLLLVSCMVFLGSAAQHMRVFQRLVCGVWQPSSVELLKPNPYVSNTSVTLAISSPRDFVAGMRDFIA